MLKIHSKFKYLQSDLFARLDGACDVLEYKLKAGPVTCAVVLELNNAVRRPITRYHNVGITPRCLCI